jgi:hypothetical protein
MDNEIDTQVLNEGIEQTIEAQDDSNLESGDSNQFTDRERQLYARLQKERDRNKELEGKVKQTIPDSKSGSFEERLELIAKGYQDEEIDFIQKNGGKKALDNEMIQDALKARKEKIEAKSKAASNISSKSGVSRTYTEGQLKQMTAEEYATKVLGQ